VQGSEGQQSPGTYFRERSGRLDAPTFYDDEDGDSDHSAGSMREYVVDGCGDEEFTDRKWVSAERRASAGSPGNVLSDLDMSWGDLEHDASALVLGEYGVHLEGSRSFGPAVVVKRLVRAGGDAHEKETTLNCEVINCPAIPMGSEVIYAFVFHSRAITTAVFTVKPLSATSAEVTLLGPESISLGPGKARKVRLAIKPLNEGKITASILAGSSIFKLATESVTPKFQLRNVDNSGCLRFGVNDAHSREKALIVFNPDNLVIRVKATVHSSLPRAFSIVSGTSQPHGRKESELIIPEKEERFFLIRLEENRVAEGSVVLEVVRHRESGLGWESNVRPPKPFSESVRLISTLPSAELLAMPSKEDKEAKKGTISVPKWLSAGHIVLSPDDTTRNVPILNDTPDTIDIYILFPGKAKQALRAEPCNLEVASNSKGSFLLKLVHEPLLTGKHQMLIQTRCGDVLRSFGFSIIVRGMNSLRPSSISNSKTDSCSEEGESRILRQQSRVSFDRPVISFGGVDVGMECTGSIRVQHLFLGRTKIVFRVSNPNVFRLAGNTIEFSESGETGLIQCYFKPKRAGFFRGLLEFVARSDDDTDPPVRAMPMWGYGGRAKLTVEDYEDIEGDRYLVSIRNIGDRCGYVVCPNLEVRDGRAVRGDGVVVSPKSFCSLEGRLVNQDGSLTLDWGDEILRRRRRRSRKLQGIQALDVYDGQFDLESAEDSSAEYNLVDHKEHFFDAALFDEQKIFMILDPRIAMVDRITKQWKVSPDTIAHDVSREDLSLATSCVVENLTLTQELQYEVKPGPFLVASPTSGTLSPRSSVSISVSGRPSLSQLTNSFVDVEVGPSLRRIPVIPRFQEFMEAPEAPRGGSSSCVFLIENPTGSQCKWSIERLDGRGRTEFRPERSQGLLDSGKIDSLTFFFRPASYGSAKSTFLLKRPGLPEVRIELSANCPEVFEARCPKREGVYFDQAIVPLPQSSLSSVVKLCNSMYYPAVVYIATATNPFFVGYRKLRLPPRSYVRLPVHLSSPSSTKTTQVIEGCTTDRLHRPTLTLTCT